MARTKLAADVAAIDRHALRPIRLDGEVRLRTVARLVRDNDVLVRVSASGRQLRAWAGRLPGEHDVVFAGYDAESGAVDGRPLNQDRTYVVVVPLVLADQELISRARGFNSLNDPGARIGLREMVTAHVRDHGTVDRWEGIRRGPRSVMEGSTRLNGSLSQTTLEGPTDQYLRDPFLSGEEALAWIVNIEHNSTRYTPAGTISAQLRTGYGRLNNNGSQREAVDRIDGELVYSLPYAQLSQFVGFDVNTVWTGGEGQKHPVVLRFKGGLQTELGSQAIVRVSLALERDRITAMTSWASRWRPSTGRPFFQAIRCRRGPAFSGAPDGARRCPYSTSTTCVSACWTILPPRSTRTSSSTGTARSTGPPSSSNCRSASDTTGVTTGERGSAGP